MAVRQWACIVALAITLAPLGAASAENLDPYGGYLDLPAPGGATGFFRVEKVGDRWVFVTPAGHVFWLRSVYMLSPFDGGAAYEQRLRAKYSALEGWPAIFAQQVRRLRAWGFNALDYADVRALPMYNPERLPFIWTLQGALYGAWEPGRVADLYVGIDSRHAVYRGHFPDVFSPQWAPAVEALLTYQRTHDVLRDVSPTYPWLIGFSTDDGDYTTGFGPGPEAGASQGKTHPHLGWVAAVTAPQQTGPWTTPRGTRVTLTDPTIYTKYAWRDFLRAKYGTVAALNAAWGAQYTTWDSDGGWPGGRGVLDESGRNPWIGGDWDGTEASRQARPAVWADLDAFLEQMADRYFAAYRAARDKHYPRHLLFTPAPMQAGTRVPILRAAGRWVDAIQSGGVPGGASYPWYRRACEVAGRPLFLWTTFTAQTDANLKPGFAPGGWGPPYNFPTQAERGQAYVRDLDGLLKLRTADGTACIVGIDWWEWTDKTVAGENMNFGLVSNLDNAYDGREARVAAGLDPWGYPTGGEPRDYGDFLGPVTAAHAMLGHFLAGQLNDLVPPSAPLTVEITSPTSGQSVQGTVSVTASASSTANRLDLLFDGSLIATFSEPNARYSWDTTRTGNGTHRWVARAYDPSGQQVESAPVEVIVNNPDPPVPLTVRITSPTNGAILLHRPSVTLAATTSTTAGVAVRFAVNGSVVCSVDAAPYRCDWTPPAEPSRRYTITATAEDARGRTAQSAPVRIVVLRVLRETTAVSHGRHR